MRSELCEHCPDEYICRQADTPFSKCPFTAKEED